VVSSEITTTHTLLVGGNVSNTIDHREWHKEPEELAPVWQRMLMYIGIVLFGLAFWAGVVLLILVLAGWQ